MRLYIVAAIRDSRERDPKGDEPGDAQIVVIGRPVFGDTLVEFRIDILVHP